MTYADYLQALRKIRAECQATVQQAVNDREAAELALYVEFHAVPASTDVEETSRNDT